MQNIAAPNALEGKSVQELQAAAEAALSSGAPQSRRGRLSRAARLHLIDQLSRWGGSGLALFAGVAVFNGVVIARALPMRSAVWALMLFAALYYCRRQRKEFRRGDHIASRPFRWRAHYTSSLAVVSAAFGAGAFLLLPTGVDAAAAMQTLALMLAATAIASSFNLAHRASAAAAGLPAFAAIAAAALISFGWSQFTVVVFVAGLSAAGFVGLASSLAARRAEQRFPRTALARREVDRTPAVPSVQPGRTAIAS
ncbi:MAG: hypothetical protein KDE05_10910 [Parvularculaceae bacterium]|nr:hypothetical protein [Parvularculaceae bacterium]